MKKLVALLAAGAVSVPWLLAGGAAAIAQTQTAFGGTAEGLWRGTTSADQTALGIVLDDGTYYVLYSRSGAPRDAGVVQGSSTALDGALTSSDGLDFPIQVADNPAGHWVPAAVSGTYVPRASLQLTIGEGSASRTVSASYDPDYDHPASLAAAAGTYTGESGSVNGATCATFTLDANGNLSGSNCAGCTFQGTITPHKSVNVFDWRVAVVGGCPPGGAATGVLYYDEANGQIHAFAPCRSAVAACETANGKEQADLYYWIGTKQAAATGQTNYQGLWWAAPAGSESGWGINFAHQGNTIFASWFTYNLNGTGMWLVMTAPQTTANTYSGTLYTTIGPPFNAVPFNPNSVIGTPVGSGTISFSGLSDGSFAYTVNGVAQNKFITREAFGPQPSCATATGSLASATNYTDLWWAAPAGSEAGWGINLTQEGSTIFATWFTYALDGTPMWLVVTAPQSAPNVYSGTLYQTTGPAFNAVPFNPNNVVPTAEGNATFTFSDGNNATFAYTVNGIAQMKAITREVFQPPGTVCQ